MENEHRLDTNTIFAPGNFKGMKSLLPADYDKSKVENHCKALKLGLYVDIVARNYHSDYLIRQQVCRLAWECASEAIDHIKDQIE